MMARGGEDGGQPSLRPAAQNRTAAWASSNGGSGDSRRRGASNTLPPSIFLPCRLPALPDTPSSYSARSHYGSRSAELNGQSASEESAGRTDSPSSSIVFLRARKSSSWKLHDTAP